MNRLVRLHADEQGFIVVAVIALVAILFLSGTAMALAVQSNLRTVGQIRNQDAVHYAVESAVARGVATSIKAQSPPDGPCGSRQPINGIDISRIECHPLGIDKASPDAVKQWAVPAGNLPVRVDLDVGDLRGNVVLWTVIGSHGAVKISMENCPALNGPAGSNYFSCPLSIKGKRSPVRLEVTGASGNVTPFIIRASQQGSKDFVVTVVGHAGYQTAQADVLIPKGGKPVLGLWGTVLP